MAATLHLPLCRTSMLFVSHFPRRVFLAKATLKRRVTRHLSFGRYQSRLFHKWALSAAWTIHQGPPIDGSWKGSIIRRTNGTVKRVQFGNWTCFRTIKIAPILLRQIQIINVTFRVSMLFACHNLFTVRRGANWGRMTNISYEEIPYSHP